MESGRSWCHRQACILSSTVSKANGAYLHLGVHAALQTRNRQELEVTVEMLVHISWQVFLKVQFRDINGAFEIVKIVSIQEVSPCKCCKEASLLSWDWDLPHSKGAGIAVNQLPGSLQVRYVQPLARNSVTLSMICSVVPGCCFLHPPH